VIYACDLEKDFARLQNGDETVTGSKGIALSGGQKQRVVSWKYLN
jgi:ATP-binding cassette, subfamily C (CFTR/MRP), member 1